MLSMMKHKPISVYHTFTQITPKGDTPPAAPPPSLGRHHGEQGPLKGQCQPGPLQRGGSHVRGMQHTMARPLDVIVILEHGAPPLCGCQATGGSCVPAQHLIYCGSKITCSPGRVSCSRVYGYCCLIIFWRSTVTQLRIFW